MTLSTPEDGNVRSLLWEAGWIIADSSMSMSEWDAVGMVTWNAADAFGVGGVGGVSRETPPDLGF